RVEVEELRELLARLVAVIEEELRRAEEVAGLLELLLVGDVGLRVELVLERVDDLPVLAVRELRARERELRGGGSSRHGVKQHGEEREARDQRHVTSAVGAPAWTVTVC